MSRFKMRVLLSAVFAAFVSHSAMAQTEWRCPDPATSGVPPAAIIESCTLYILRRSGSAEQLAAARALRAGAYARQDDLSAALADISEAIKMKPQEARLYYERGQFHDRRSDYDNAIADYSQAIGLAPDTMNHFYRAQAYSKRGADDFALNDYLTALKFAPSSTVERRLIAAILLRRGDHANALAYVESFLAAVKPEDREPGEKLRNEIVAERQRFDTTRDHAARLFASAGLTGTFATACAKPPSLANPFYVYRDNGHNGIQVDILTGSQQREYMIVDIAGMIADQKLLAIDQSRERTTLIAVEFDRNGGQRIWRLIMDGLRTIEEARAVGTFTSIAWLTRCA